MKAAPTKERKKSGIDWSKYKEERFSQAQIERSSTLVINNPEMEQEARFILEEAYQYYDNLDKFRTDRRKYVDLYIGEHYNGLIYDPDSDTTMTKGDYIRSKGMEPVKNNQTRQVIKNLIGQFRKSDVMSTVIARERDNQLAGEMMTKTLHAALQLNETQELDVGQFVELLVSGFFAWRTTYGYHDTRRIMDIDVVSPHPARMVFNTGITDPRLREIHFIGELLDPTMDEILQAFAKNKYDRQQILDWYGVSHRGGSEMYYGTNENLMEQNSESIDNIDFYNVSDAGRYRVYEFWKKQNEEVLLVLDPDTGRYYEAGEDEDEESLEEQNWIRLEEGTAMGVEPDQIPLLSWEYKNVGIWYFWALTPQGNILFHGRTPYEHGEHPYTLGLYPLIDGNIFGLIKDIEDQQEEINRMLTKMKFILSASAQGLLMIPEDSIPDGWTEDDFADQYSKSNGVIVYKPSKTGAKPEQIHANSINTGAMDILQIQFNLLKEISGVNEAMQGQKPNAGTPSSLYAQMTENSSLANLDFFEFFFNRRKIRDFKIVHLMQQYYDEDRNIAIAGKDFDSNITHYIQELGRNVEFDMVMGKSQMTDAYRQLADQNLMMLWQAQAIDTPMLLEHSSMPFADKLLASIREKEMQIQEMQAQGQTANPQAQQLMQQFMSPKAPMQQGNAQTSPR
jgi:hypothetical protein